MREKCIYLISQPSWSNHASCLLLKATLLVFTGDHSHKTLEIARNRFFAIREKIRQKYANWNEFVLPLGRLSEFSSLRKLQMEKYRMQEVLIDRKCAAPRFVIKPQSTFAVEGHSARFTCRIISLTATTISWYHNNVELRQSVKYMKR